MTSLEWNYYDAMLAQDEEELRNYIIEGVEYLAWFMQPDMVKKIQQARREHANQRILSESDFAAASATDDQFASLVAKMSGNEDAPVFRKR